MTGFAGVLAAKLEHFIALIADDAHAQSLAQDCDLPPEKARLLLNTYCNEARVGLALIAPALKPGLRVLEVGSGIGLVASVLADEGVEITGIEPGAAGFGFMPALASIVTACISSAKPFKPLPIGVAELNPHTHGNFDLIYSVNVLEHLVELDAAVEAMARVLAHGGEMIHMCPNYAVPYEPHFMIPLIPGLPNLTRYLYPSHARRYPGLWDGLNFITAGRLRRLAKRNGLETTFDQRIMGDMARRIITDPILAARQGKVIKGIATAMQKTGALAIVDRVPPGFATPMIARCTKR